MKHSLYSYKNVVYVKNIKVQAVFGRLAMLASKKKLVYNLLFDVNTDDPYVVIYTSDPEDLIKIIRENETITQYQTDLEIEIKGNKHFRENDNKE